MKKSILTLLFLSFIQVYAQEYYGLALHGGAGSIYPERYTKEQIKSYEQSLKRALNHGYSLLEQGKSAEEVVVAVIEILELDSLFNAGRGAVLNSKGEAELDASIMRGSDKNAGAVSGLKKMKSPIKAAQTVMNKSPHVMLYGEGAEEFLKTEGLDTVANGFFITQKMKASWEADKKPSKMGTVGCVVMDKKGNLAAGTSTGGMMMKRNNRIGDSPILGAGTWADNASIAVSCTGHGEFFIRTAAAYQAAARVQFAQQDLREALDGVLAEIKELGGIGGMIAIDNQANIQMRFNTQGMFRACRNNSGTNEVLLFGE